NINVTKDADGNITGAGDRKTTIKGDFVTNGGMGSKGQISVGLKGEESFWEGKYTDNVGYGVTPGQLGSVNLWIEDGAHWTGYSSGSVNLNLSGDGSYWDGYSTNNKMLLSLKNGATWKNSNASQTSLIGNFIGDGGSIDMTGGVTIDNYSGNTMVLYKHDAETPTNIIGGDITIKSAAEDSSITLRTDSDGIDLGSRDSVEGTLDALAHKLYYTGYVDGERNLTGSVEIAEGLTTSSVKKVYGSIGYSDTNGQGSLDGGAQGFIPSSQEQDTFTTPIRGLNEEVYINAGVLKDGVYEFTMYKTTLNVDKSEIAGGPWLGNIGSAVSASGVGTKTVIDLNGNDFEVNATHSSNHSTGITAINDGIVEINSPGDITVTATGGGQTAALFANGSGEIHIHNGEGGTVIARADAASVANGAVIKTMHGKAGESKIIIDGMVDVVADAENGANEAISAVASRIEIGGGNIEAKNGAWAAIRAYGEFMTQNSGIVNVNVTKDADGNITGAGDRKTTIKGDFVTNGGMGSKGQISVGLNGKDSFWEGNYTDNVGYGVTPGQLGSVNLWVENGAHWKGFANGSVNLNLSGKDSYW
ncbi:MAG: autotransporter outer membrane beta-barrel domain-containing protein, partial [Selenomonadales bacterium]|nr:autotransporter outer membrane beta-barrel domain-containing protein [Selenomonadales bacterium]